MKDKQEMAEHVKQFIMQVHPTQPNATQCNPMQPNATISYNETLPNQY